MYVIELKDLPGLFSALRSRGFTVIGPTLRDGAIVLDAITGVDDLPRGWTDVQVAAGYQVRKRKDEALFGFSVSPMSWKKFLFPPRVKLFAAERSGKGFVIAGDKGGQPSAPAKLAFLGLRSCELHALAIHDKVFASGQYADTTYTEVRKSAIVIAVNCTAAGGTCFCDSMGTGPRAASGYDIALTEILADGRHHFLAEGGCPCSSDHHLCGCV